MLRPLYLLLSLLLPWWCNAALAAVDVSHVPPGGLVLTSHFDLRDDPGRLLDIDQIRADRAAFKASAHFDSAQGRALNFGYGSAAHWLRLELVNTSDAPLQRLLEISNARLNDISVFYPGADGRYEKMQTGSTFPYHTRAYRDRQFVFPLQLPPHSRQTIYLRVTDDGSTVIPATLWTPADHVHHERQDYIVQGVYFGMALAMLLFNLVLYATLRDRLYLIYVAFVGTAALALACHNGLAHEWLWPQLGGSWPNIATAVVVSFSAAMLLAFMRRMLATREHAPWLDRVLQLLHWHFLLLAPTLALFYQHIAEWSSIAITVSAPVVLGVAATCALRGQRSAMYFTGAFVVFLIASLSGSLAALGMIPHSLLSDYGPQLGSACEMMVLAFALAHRVLQMRRDKEQAQDRLIAWLQHSERELELRVAERTLALQRANAELATLSLTDSLTGLANRRRYDQYLQAEWARATREQSCLAVGLLDIDYFKQYNDRYGHPAGDACLQQVARALNACLRRSADLVARYGGEEFALIAPGLNAAAAQALAQDACDAVAALRLPHLDAPSGIVTASVGVAARQPQAGAAASQLVHEADMALYQAKQDGKNRVCLAE